MWPTNELHNRKSWRCVGKIRKRKRCVLACVTSYDYQILRPSGLVDDKAVLATRVTEIRAGSRESSAAPMRVLGAIVRAWWRVRLLLEVEFLGFVHDMPWSTYVLLVSLGEGLMCTDLILMSRVCLSLLNFDTAQSHGGCEMP